MTKLDARLERAKEYLAIAESDDSKREAYKRAAEEIAACVESDGMTQVAVATALGRSRALVRQLLDWRKSGYKADTPWLHDKDATKRAARSHARQLLSDPDEAAKLLSDPEVRRSIEHAQEQRLVNRPGTGHTPEPRYPLLHRIENDRLRLEADAQLMVGHWHDGRHDISDEEARLVRDSMAQAVLAVEEKVTTALRGDVSQEVT